LGCLGVHFALSAEDVAALRRATDDEARREYVQEVLEEQFAGGPRAAESDKAWDAMHRALSDGHLTWNGGSYPLNHVVLGGEVLYGGDDYIMSLKSPVQVRDIASVIRDLSETEFRERYDTLDRVDYDGELGNDDFSYTWESFQDVRELYLRASNDGLSVLFTADQ
jgi:hypothetical protein